MNKIQRVFAQEFEHWGIAIPDDALFQRRKGSISKGGWQINYIVDRDDKGLYLEYYACHRMTNDRHVKIYQDGTRQELDAPQEFYVFHDSIHGDKEKKEKEYYEHNRRVYEELKRKGLLL